MAPPSNEYFRVCSPAGETVQSAVAYPITQIDRGNTFAERGIGAVFALEAFGPGFCEPYVRWAWQHRDLIVQETNKTATLEKLFPSRVRLRINQNDYVPLPWHPDSFTVLYVVTLLALGKTAEAVSIRDVSGITDFTAKLLIQEAFEHAPDHVEGPIVDDSVDNYGDLLFDDLTVN